MSIRQKSLITSLILVISSLILWACTSQNLDQPQFSQMAGKAIENDQESVNRVQDVQEAESLPSEAISKLTNPSMETGTCLSSPGSLITLSGNYSVYINKQ
ncbi:MAG: hypothetical protein ACK2U3_11405, partial [Anaerolineales bacterium]